MTTYALLIYRSTPAAEPIPELDEKQTLADHRALQADAAARNQLHAVARLDEPGAAEPSRRTPADTRSRTVRSSSRRSGSSVSTS